MIEVYPLPGGYRTCQGNDQTLGERVGMRLLCSDPHISTNLLYQFGSVVLKLRVFPQELSTLLLGFFENVLVVGHFVVGGALDL